MAIKVCAFVFLVISTSEIEYESGVESLEA